MSPVRQTKMKINVAANADSMLCFKDPFLYYRKVPAKKLKLKLKNTQTLCLLNVGAYYFYCKEYAIRITDDKCVVESINIYTNEDVSFRIYKGRARRCQRTSFAKSLTRWNNAKAIVLWRNINEPDIGLKNLFKIKNTSVEPCTEFLQQVIDEHKLPLKAENGKKGVVDFLRREGWLLPERRNFFVTSYFKPGIDLADLGSLTQFQNNYSEWGEHVDLFYFLQKFNIELLKINF